MQRKDVERLADKAEAWDLSDDDKGAVAAILRVLLDRAKRAEAELSDLRNGWANSVKAHAEALAERDAAFAAGQEEMRRRAVAATVSVETDHPSWVNAGSWACASELCGIRINDLPIKPRP